MKISSFTRPSDSFSGNVLKLMTGNVFAQALVILVMPVVTRLFAPEAYGILALFTSLTGIVGVIACLRYELAIILPETNEEAVNIFGVSLSSALIVTFLSTLIVLLGSEEIIGSIRAPQLRNYLLLLPVAIFFQGVYLALTYWNSRTKHFGRLSIAQIIASLSTQASTLAAGFAGFVSGGVLIGASVFGRVIATVTLGSHIWRDDKNLILDHISWKGILKGYVRFKKFSLIDTWGGLLNTISWQLPALMLSSFFSMSVVGFYSLGLTAIKTPLSIISNALSQVFYQKSCAEKNINNNNGELVEILMDKLMFIGFVPTIFLAIVGEELFTIIFGARWAEAGRYAQILAPWILFWFISSPLSTLFLVYERQGAALSVHSVIFLTRVVSLYIGGIYQNIYLALLLFSLTGIASYAFVAAWNIKLARAKGRRILASFFKYCLRSLPILLFLFIIKYILHFGPVLIFSSSLLVVPFYFLRFRK